MATTILFSNLKGGVGKTTSAINTAASLAKQGFKCLLLDLDPQGNASKNLGLLQADYTVSDLLIHGAKLKAQPVRENLVMIPSNFKFSRFETEAKDRIRREEILKNALDPIQERCDFIIIDSPPSLGLITINAYTCADFIIIPLEAQMFAIDGLMEVIKLIQAVKSQLNNRLELAGILFTRHRKNIILNKDIYSEMEKEFSGKTFHTVIRENVALREAPHNNMTILDYDPDSNGAHDYMKLTEELLNRIVYERV